MKNPTEEVLIKKIIKRVNVPAEKKKEKKRMQEPNRTLK